MKSFRKKVQRRKKEGPALSSEVNSNLQWLGKRERASDRESKGGASKVRGNQKGVVP